MGANEATTITRLEQRYMKKRRCNIYIALEELDFIWSYKEIEEFDQLWREGYSLNYISDYFNRDIDEVAILLIDRTKKGYCKPRENGIR
ncbi:hypothetical protein [Fictibacillus gelatini]|uniref:hypothetical protein n=1 Tax=Fictibacillus gelatini TaxID=225985 RepID=UPI0004148C20|nr:hypothetical protein [Fictibacillus gelatini]